MTLYFTMDRLFQSVEKSEKSGAGLRALTPVSREPWKGVVTDDIFMLTSEPRLLDLSREDAAVKLAALLAEIPLYHVNMELTLDDALAERHHNAPVRKALDLAFIGEDMPSTLRNEKPKDDEPKGGLRHPMLGHLDVSRLCTLYLGFITALGGKNLDYSFGRNIIGLQSSRFTDFYDGFLQNGLGAVRADLLLESGIRSGHDPAQPLESCVQNGREQAEAMNIADPGELVWAWVEADACQMKRCLDIHRAKRAGLTRTPGWVRMDVFALLQKEAMKHKFTETLASADPGLSIVREAPLLRRAMQSSLEGKTDEMLQQLLTQTLNVDASYAGSAEKFVEAAARRQQEARKQGLA